MEHPCICQSICLLGVRQLFAHVQYDHALKSMLARDENTIIYFLKYDLVVDKALVLFVWKDASHFPLISIVLYPHYQSVDRKFIL